MAQACYSREKGQCSGEDSLIIQPVSYLERGRKCPNLTLNRKLDVWWTWGWRNVHRIPQKVVNEGVTPEKGTRYNLSSDMSKRWGEIVNKHRSQKMGVISTSGPSGAVWAEGKNLQSWQSARQRVEKEHFRRLPGWKPLCGVGLEGWEPHDHLREEQWPPAVERRGSTVPGPQDAIPACDASFHQLVTTSAWACPLPKEQRLIWEVPAP